MNPLDKRSSQENHARIVGDGWGGPMLKTLIVLAAGLGIAAASAPALSAGSSGFLVRVGDLKGTGGYVDKKSGQQWIPIISWEWGEYVVAKGAPAVVSDLHPQGYYDKGSILVNAKFEGCEVGKTVPEAILKTPGMRYTFTDVTITDCDEKDMTFNYGAIRASAAW